MVIPEQPEPSGLPEILPDEELDARIRASQQVAAPVAEDRGPTDRELAAKAVALLKAQFPHIHGKLVPLWGKEAGEQYLDSLILDERGNRQGFPPEALSALLVLQRIHFERFGTFRKTDLWQSGED